MILSPKPVGMQVAYMKPELQQSVLEKIEEYFSGVEYNPAIIFRGDDEPVFSKKNIFERPDSQTTGLSRTTYQYF